jgi:hypothetical protein
MAKPWIEDAKEYQAIADLSESGIYLTAAVRDYLDPENKHRTVVVAPKGCGKTLLIKHKRKSLENRGWELLPENQLVSQPPYAPGFDNARMTHIREHPEYWSIIWQIAIVTAVLRKGWSGELPLKCAPLVGIWNSDRLDDPFHIFVQLLGFPPAAYHEAEADFLSVLLPAFGQRRRSQVGIFIDNVDECFGGHLGQEKRSGLFGLVARDFWHDAQMGLLMAARRISSYNTHVKVFATIRTEAYTARQHKIPDLANVRTHMSEIRFDKDDLRHIFEENIRNEARDRLAEADAADQIVRLVGRQSATIRHLYTGRLEPLFDYVHRHTFGRPRDLMTIGRAIASLRRDQRTPNAVREAVNSGAASVATSYLTEVSPHLDWFQEDLLFQKFRSNVLTADGLAAIELQYDKDRPKQALPDGSPAFYADGRSAFADMYAAGLLGVTQRHSVLPRQTQHFTSVFDMHNSYSREMRVLPDSKFYLLHNVLGSYVRRRYGGGWHPHTVNVVEPGSAWHEDDGLLYVMQIDVCGSTRIRLDPVLAEQFHREIERAVALSADSAVFRESYNGDSMALADRNGYVLVRAAQNIAAHLKSRLGVDIRAGLDFGPATLATTAEGKLRLDRGVPIWRSRQLESSSGPGALLALPETVQRLGDYEVQLPFVGLTQDMGHRAKWTRRGWRIAEKTKASEAETYPVLMTLPLHGNALE